jgi:diadenosine tetraphosphate (Ap4A) HIT family hydrolase
MWLQKIKPQHYIMMDDPEAGNYSRPVLTPSDHVQPHAVIPHTVKARMTDARINRTIENFGYPTTLVCDMGEWLVLLRPRQVTLGSLIIAAAHPATSFAELPPSHFTTLGAVMSKVETTLKTLFHCDKVNYLALMMVDPHVHYHVIPRYSQAASFAGHMFPDYFWPKPPDVTHTLEMKPETFKLLHDALKNAMG